MGLIRLLLIAAAVVVALVLIKRVLGGRPAPKIPPRTSDAPKLVQCAFCGVHVGEREAIRKGDQYFCSSEHLQRSENR